MAEKARTKKTWAQKLETGATKIEIADKRFAGVEPGQRMLISTPKAVRDYMAAIPRGETRSIADMRQDLARAAGAEVTCPLTTGIFARIASEAALEEIAGGKRPHEVTPFWRVVEPKSALARKLSCGPDFIEHQRTLEGAAGRASGPGAKSVRRGP